jgi:signal transduction histidine kinase
MNFGNLEEHRSANPAGRGLGLSICKSIVEQMGGSITVESAEGEGTKFNLTFKVASYPNQNNSSSERNKMISRQ